MSTDESDSVGPKEMGDHAWRYFALHAGQRISVFNFFLIMSSTTCAGLGATIQGDGHLAPLGAVLGVLLLLIAFVFWKLDQRTAFLVKIAEQGIMEFETRFPVPSARIVCNERSLTDGARLPSSPTTRLWTYSVAFRFVFTVMAFVGVCGTALSIARAARWIW